MSFWVTTQESVPAQGSCRHLEDARHRVRPTAGHDEVRPAEELQVVVELGLHRWVLLYEEPPETLRNLRERDTERERSLVNICEYL